MSHIKSKRFVGATAATVLAFSGAAVGQEPIADDQRKLGVITVTAERRTESTQDVGQSVQAFDEAGLDRAGVDDVSRLDQIVSGVNFAFVGNDAKFNVRGANSTNTFGDVSSIVGTFVDGVYQPRASMQSRGFFDVQRLEFLKGPQGTLYGRNTFAGALNLYSNGPDLSGFSAGIDASYERFNTRRVEGFANIPLSDTLGVRVAAFTERGDGYIENFAGADLGAPDDVGGRISVLWEPTPDLQILARYSNVTERGVEAGLFGYTFECRNVTAQGLTDPLGEFEDCANPLQGSSGIPDADDLGPYEVSQDFAPNGDLEQNQASLEINYDFGPITVKSITGYTDFSNLLGFDGDFSPFPHTRFWFNEENESISQEFLFASDYDSPLQWTAGAYYSEDESFFSFALIDQTAEIANRPTVIGPGGETFTLFLGTPIASNETIIPGGEFADVGVREIEYFGIFGQAEYTVTDSFRITAGLRFNDESRTLVGAGSNFTGDTDGDGVAEPPVTFTQQVLDNPSPVIVPTNPNTVFALDENADDAISGDVSFDNVSWRLGAEYDFNDEIMLYINAATGFLSGAISNGGSATDEQESQVIEVGFKSSLLADSLLLNGAVHVTEYTNLLRQRQDIIGGIAVTSSDNGGQIDAMGVEIEAVYFPTPDLRLSGTLAYLDSEFGDDFFQGNPYQLFGGEVVPSISVAGETTPWSPELTFNLSGDYTFDLGDRGTLTPGISFYYSDEYFTSNLYSPDPNQLQDSYTKTDLRVRWDDPTGAYAVEAFIENVEDEAVLARGNNNSSDVVQTGYLYPQNYGVRVKARF
ncbi:MAG: TonB-dependent receptor [Pseudomonadota bacterium]